MELPQSKLLVENQLCYWHGALDTIAALPQTSQNSASLHSVSQPENVPSSPLGLQVGVTA